MAFCGISHKVVNTDLEGITECLRWTAFSQPFHQSINPSFPVPPKDPVGRKVAGFLAETALKDPRAFLSSPGGLFDEGSFWECQRQWARSVMVGRARLGGVPVGVISPEGSVTEKTVLADPALIESRECVVPQAGNVNFYFMF